MSETEILSVLTTVLIVLEFFSVSTVISVVE